jgi:hypothetical protein
MLNNIFKKHPITSAHSYLYSPDLNNNQLKTRGRGEALVYLCDYDIELTEELKLYLSYFNNKVAHICKHNLTSFSNIPIKLCSEEKC